jgi:hypothetical protein
MPEVTIDPRRFSKIGKLEDYNIMGYLLVLTKGKAEDIMKIEESEPLNGIDRKVYFFNQTPLDMELSDFEKGQDYCAQILSMGKYKIKYNNEDSIRNDFIVRHLTFPIPIKIPDGFVKKKDNAGQDIHVSLADLYANRDKYDGKVIEVEGYLDRGGHKIIAKGRTRSSGGIADGNYLLKSSGVLSQIGVKGHQRTGEFNYVDFIGYFHKEMNPVLTEYDKESKNYKKQLVAEYYMEMIIIVSISKR